MKKAHVFLFIVVLTGFAVFVVSSSVRKSSVWQQNRSIADTVEKIGCSDKSDRSVLLAKAQQRSLRSLGEFEAQCESQVTSEVLYTVDFVVDEKYVESWARQVAADVREFAELEINPIVVVQLPTGAQLASTEPKTTTASPTPKASPSPPVLTQGSTVSSKAWKAALEELVRQGVKPSVLQQWILFPESNVARRTQPALTPSEYGTYVSAAAREVQLFFPDAKFGLVFNAMTFEQAGFSWGDQEYVSWLPYLEKVDKNLVSSLGIVAFPWLPVVSDERPALMEPAEYIPEWIIAEAVQYTGAKSVWLYTGTFASLHAEDPAQKITVPADIRKEWLQKTLVVLEHWAANGWATRVVFSNRDVRVDGSASDWSYWGTEDTANQNHKWVALEFLVALRQRNIPVVLSL